MRTGRNDILRLPFPEQLPAAENVPGKDEEIGKQMCLGPVGQQLYPSLGIVFLEMGVGRCIFRDNVIITLPEKILQLQQLAEVTAGAGNKYDARRLFHNQ